MNTESFGRKLTPMFSADAARYSRLMDEKEAATVKTLTVYRDIMWDSRLAGGTRFFGIIRSRTTARHSGERSDEECRCSIYLQTAGCSLRKRSF